MNRAADEPNESRPVRDLIPTLDRSSLGPRAAWSGALRSVVDLILASPNQIVLFWGPDFIALYNDAYAPTIGNKHPAAFGQPAIEHWTELWEDLHPLLQSVRDTGRPVVAKDRPFYIERHGYPETVYFDIAYSSVPEADGSVGGVLCIVNETTDRVGADRRLRESEARLQAISNSIDQMVWSTRPDGHHDYYNQRWYDYTGVPEGSTDGDAWNGMFHPDDQERAWAAWRHSLATGEPYRIEYRLRHRSGQYRWVLGRAQAVRDERGRIARWFGTCTDIQEIVDAREVLATSREALTLEVATRTHERDRIWQVSRDLLGIADQRGVWLSVNPAWTRVLGWQPEEVVGRTSDWLHHPDDFERTQREIEQLAAGQETLAFENRFLTSDGTYRRLSWTAIVFEDRIYAAGRDITDQRTLEDRLHQAQKMEALGQLTGGIAHDFNNMLAVVIGSLDLLERRLARGETDVSRYVGAALDGANRAASLTQRLLAFSRRQPLEPETLDANRLIAGMTDLLRRTLGEPVLVETKLAEGLWRATADASQLENAIINLAVNARDAMQAGGSLTIATGNALVDDDYAEEYQIAPGEYVLISVGDTGAGMSPAVLAKAVDPFFTTKPVGKGTGLGLSQVFGFARQSGGHLKIFSTPNVGTTVMFYLPRAHEAAARDESADPASAPTDAGSGGSSEIVMVVEDEERVRSYSVEALRVLGYAVVEAASPREALATIESGQDVTLLFTDVVMPEMNGRELATRATALLPGLKVLYTTGYTRDAPALGGAGEPGSNILTKPFDIDQLGAKLRYVLDA